MHFSTSSVAFLLFTRPASQEAVNKPLTPARRRGERIWQTMESLAWGKVKATQLPAFLSYQLIDQAVERPFGEQLRRAAQAVLDQGYETVLCLGTDCAGLRVADLRSAAQLTQLTAPGQPVRGTLPMGVDQRGGVYLVGLNAAVLQDTEAFDTLPWQTAQLAQALAERIHEQKQWVARLPATYRDWNTSADVYLDEAVGEPACLLTLTNLLKHVAGLGPAAQSIYRTIRFPTPAGLRAPPQA